MAVLPAFADGGVFGTFIDWRGYPTVHSAAVKLGLKPLNLVVWTKTNAGMGSLYRSQHELLPVFKRGSAPHVNNIQLGKHGRWRSNVWTYPGASSLGSDARRGRARWRRAGLQRSRSGGLLDNWLTRGGRWPSAEAVDAHRADWKRARPRAQLLRPWLRSRPPARGRSNPGILFAALQQRLRRFVAPPPSALGGVARAHRVAAIIEQLAGEERVRGLDADRSSLCDCPQSRPWTRSRSPGR